MAETNWADLHRYATTALEGEHPLVIVEATAGKTADQSKEQIKWKAKIESGPFVDRPISGNFTLSTDNPTAMRFFFQHLAILGIDGAFFAANPNAPMQMIADSLVGRRAIGVLGTRQWNGRDFDEVKEWKPALGGPGGSAVSAGPLGLAAATPAATPLGGSPAGSSPASPVSVAQPSTPAPEVKF